MALTILETERLRLRPWRPADDLPAFAALHADPVVMRCIGRGRPLTRDESAALLDGFVRHWDEHGFGLWAVEPRSARRRCIGAIGLAIPAFLPQVLPAVEVGWRLAPAWWGRGLATEGARASVRHAFDGLGLSEVISIIDPGNAASLRVAAKLGMQPGRDRLHPVTRRRVRVLELTPR